MATAILNIRSKDNDDSLEGLGADDIINRGLLASNCFLLNGDIDFDSVGSAIRWIIYENTKPETKTLTIYINSIGGFVDDAFALIDVIKNSKHIIRTVGIGNVMSSAFLIFSAGTKGHRFIGKNANILSHQYSDEVDGKHHDIKSYMKVAEFTQKRMVDLLKDATGLDTATVRRKLFPPSDVWLTPQEMLNLGIADKVF